MQPLPALPGRSAPLSIKCEVQKWITIIRSELAPKERWVPTEHAAKTAVPDGDWCDVFRWVVISVDEALRTDGAKRCVECQGPVRPHKASNNGMAAHFEQLSRNPNCSLSDNRWRNIS